MGNSYDGFIEEAFIRPIRSVLIVDDDFPTYREILSSRSPGPDVRRQEEDPGPGEKSLDRAPDDGRATSPTSARREKRWRQNPQLIWKLIEHFRSSDLPLLVDIDDGTHVSSSGARAAHLHQSDLLILDYELDKSRSEDGARAIEIVRALMINQHFNLVVIYTNLQLSRIAVEVLMGMRCPLPPLEDAEQLSAEELLAGAETGNDSLVEGSFEASVGVRQYLSYRRSADTSLDHLQNDTIFERFFKLAKSAGWRTRRQELVLSYLLRRVEALYAMNDEASGTPLKLRDSLEGEVRWIKSDSVFICFSGKSDTPSDLMKILRTALADWGPTPPRLFLTKLRAEMDEVGVALQDNALKRSRASAVWYRQLLMAQETERRALIGNAVGRHSEILMDLVLPRVEEFGRRLLANELKNVPPEGESAKRALNAICDARFRDDWRPGTPGFDETALLEHNEFVCSKPAGGWHLTTGHVFRAGGSFWVCLSPACDMVPSRKVDSSEGCSYERLGFVAVKLQREERRAENIQASNSQHMFVSVDDEVLVFRFNRGRQSNSNPEWQFFFAEDGGPFESTGLEKGQLALDVQMVEQSEGGPVWRKCNATVVAQLRYEYALNFVQKMATALSRIGLEFADKRAIQ